MASDQMKIDYGNLEHLSTKLSSALNVVGRDLEGSVLLAADCGDAGLARKVVGFSTSWNKHRLDIRDTLDWLQGTVKNIRDELEAVDTQLAAGLNSEGSAVMAPGVVAPGAVAPGSGNSSNAGSGFRSV
ncbi:hypothetical protein [Salinibacterium sp. M195]|uniref:hypothetical protein n=1 Tax=Salinibacterium sp. M195 TaxID=2583374 RepID=UPI001C62901F|nr:hypothetical protein [Salinibacterium sp. M195]QYH35710.1 hypothetical protein FFT87_06930 [Salinibacterium sp. M195]